MQLSLRTYLFAAAASLALLGTGWVHGYWTDRWVTSVETTTAAERLPCIPMNLGDWEGREIETKPNQIGPGVAGCVQRSYFNRHRGVTVVLALVCGRPGPVATHTPEVCYGASGYLVGDKRLMSVEWQGPAANFWTSDAVRTKVTEETKVRLYWAWNGGQGWAASRDARLEFPRYRHPVLHKLYVIRDLAGSDTSTKDEPCEAFLQVLLPALQQSLFAPGS
jgi:Protein of unknown function (DUF3485)